MRVLFCSDYFVGRTVDSPEPGGLEILSHSHSGGARAMHQARCRQLATYDTADKQVVVFECEVFQLRSRRIQFLYIMSAKRKIHSPNRDDLGMLPGRHLYVQ